RHEQDNTSLPGIAADPFQPLLDVDLPIASWLQTIHVEPDFVPAALEILLEACSQSCVLVVTVAEEDTPSRHRLVETELALAILAQADSLLLVRDHVRRTAFRAANALAHHKPR